MADHHRYRLDDLRRFGVALASSVGVLPARGSALVSGLLWYDAADAPPCGIASLTGWIAAIEAGDVDPISEGKITRESPASAVIDGGNGIGPLTLRRAAEVAQEKAREVGVGMVQVVKLGRSCPVGWVASEIAIGPMIGRILSPEEDVWAEAVPLSGSMPLVIEARPAPSSPRPEDSRLAPVPKTGPLSHPGAWVVTARAVTTFESLASFHERVGRALESAPDQDGEVRPADWQARRLAQIEHGLTLSKSDRRELEDAGRRLGVPFPEPSA